MGMKIIMEVFHCHWQNLSKNARLLVIYHELMHLQPEERAVKFDKKYRLVHHDVQEFANLIETYGVHWQHKKSLPNILKKKVKIYRPQHEMPVMG